MHAEETLINHFFNSELNLLKELASEFARANPALAPHLGGPGTDPDVERLLEAVAFQNAMLRQKLDADFPELVRNLAQLILPHYLRPIPATTIIGFTANTTSGQSATIPAGTQLASAPIDGTACRFTTSTDVTLEPLELTDASFAPHSGGTGEIRLALTLKGLPLERWQPAAFRLFLAGDHASATELYLLLSRHVSRIVLTPGDGGASVTLPSDCLTPAGFSESDALLPYPPHAAPSYRLLQEYFSTPEKFLFFDLTGWERWQQRGNGMPFSISFELDSIPFQPQRVRRDSFALHAVPAINLFHHEADPISIKHRSGSYLIRPTGIHPAHCQVFSVDRVTGYTRTTGRERSYLPFDLFSSDSSTEPIYQALLSQSLRHRGHDVHLGVAFPGGIAPNDPETLSIALTCTNGSLPDSLHTGDINVPLSPLPDFVSARNIAPINPGQSPPLGPGLLRQLTSHLCLNQLSLEHVEHLQTVLELYLFPSHHPGSRVAANRKRISGIEAIDLIAVELMVSGLPMRGKEIRVKVRQDHFAGPGDLYLFGCLLDHFLGSYASMQSFTRLVFHETVKGGTCQWPTRLGNQTIR